MVSGKNSFMVHDLYIRAKSIRDSIVDYRVLFCFDMIYNFLL